MTTEAEAERAKGREQLRLLITGGLYVVSTAALLRAIPLFLDNPMAATVLGAAAVSLIAARADVRTERFGPRARRRALLGVAIAALAVTVGVAVALASGASLAVVGLGAASLFGVAEAVAIGYAREMWLRGIPLTFARRAGVPERWALAFVVLAGPAAVALESSARPLGIVLTAAASAAFGALWLRGGDGYGPIAAHIAWVWLTDAALSGELFDLGREGGRLTAQPGAQGAVALGAAAAFGVAALLVLGNKLPVEAASDFPTDAPEPSGPAPRSDRARAKPAKVKRAKRAQRATRGDERGEGQG